jgi:hypothetical protein
VLVVARRGIGAALHESEIDAGAGIAQQRDVFRGALRRAQLHGDAVLLQDLRVALGEFGVGPWSTPVAKTMRRGGVGSSSR